jgi:CBS domain-containing protein
MRVRELMNRNLVTISESSSCHAAIRRMHRARVRHLPVLSDDGALVGVVTDRDLRHYLFRPHVRKDIAATSIELLLKAVTVDEIMSAPVLTVDAADEVTDAARMMLEDKVGSLPVTEGGRLVGIITETDLLREICRADPACSPEVTDIVVSHR